MSGRRKIHLRHPAVVDIGCNCHKPKLFSSLFSSSSSSPPKPKPKPKHNVINPSATTTTTASSCTTSSTWDPYFNSDTPSPPPPPPQRTRRRRKKSGRVARESVAVVKETSEPYSDFKESMARMIVEKEIYRWDDLNDLLHRFLSLNSPRHHHLILRAFADLWNGATASAVTEEEDDDDDDAAAPPYYVY